MTSTLPRQRLATATVGLLLAIATSAIARAQTTYTWDGGGGDNLWNTGANWVGDAAPSRGVSTFVTFAGSTRTSPFNNQGDWEQLAGMSFASGAGGFRIEGNNIGFVNGSGEQVIAQNAATTQEINAVFSFGQNQNSRIDLNAGDLLITSANLYIDVTSAVARQVFIGGSDGTRRTVTLATTVQNSGSGQDGDLVIRNNKRVLVTGTLLNGTGNDTSVFVNDGVLQFSGAGTMTGGAPVIGDTTGSANAALWLDTAGATFARQVEIRGGSSGQRMVGGVNTSGTVTYSGNFVATNLLGDYDLKAASGGAANFSGSRNFTAPLYVNRPDGVTTYGGTVILSGTTNSTDGTKLAAGTLQFGNFNQLGSDYFEFDAASGDSGTLRYTGGSTTTTRTLWLDNTGITRAAIDVSEAGTTLTWNPGGGTRSTNLTKTGAGWLFFGGGISGGTVGVESGLLVLTASNSYSGGTTITGGTVEVSAGGGEGGSAAGLGTGTVSIGSGGQVTYWLSQSASNTITNAFSLSGGTLYTQDGLNTYSGQVTLAAGSSTIAGRYEDTIRLSGGLAGSGNVLFTQAGGTGAWAAPTYVLSGTGSNTGTVRVSGSSGGGATKLQLANANALQSATLDMATGDVGTVEFTVAGSNTYALGGLQGTRNLAFGGNSLSVGGNGQSTAYSGNLSGSGLLAKVGNGTLTLSGSNSASGGLAVNAGTLGVGSANALGSSGTISFGGGSLQYSASNTTDYSARFSNEASQQYRIDTNGQNVTLGSNLTSSGGSLTKFGSGTLTLTGTNTYDIDTTVSGGRLVATTSQALPTNVVNNAELEFVTTGGNYSFSGTISGTGSLIKSGSDELNLAGANTYTGGTIVAAGALVGSADSLQGPIANSGTVAFGIDGDGTYAGVISGSGSLEVRGGHLSVTGTSVYSGGTTIVGGGRLSVNGALGSTAVTVQGGGVLGGSGVLAGSVLVDGAGVLSPGNSIASLAVGSTTFSGTAEFVTASAFEYEVDSTDLGALGIAADLLVVSGNLNLDLTDSTILTFTDLDSTPNPFVDDTTIFALINYSGTWNGGLFIYNGNVLADGSRFLVGSQEWEIDYNRSSSTGLDNFTGDYLPSSSFVAVTAVPEPTALAMSLAGLACGGWMLRRRRV